MDSVFVEGGRYYAGLQVAVAMAVGELQDEWRDLLGGPVGMSQSCYKDSQGGHTFSHEYAIHAGNTQKSFGARCTFTIEQLPACCGLALLQLISTARDPEKDLCIKTACLAAKIAGYTVVQYTSTRSQDLDNALSRAGFKAVNTFRSVRTGNEITVWLKNLYDKPKVAEAKKEREMVVA